MSEAEKVLNKLTKSVLIARLIESESKLSEATTGIYRIKVENDKAIKSWDELNEEMAGYKSKSQNIRAAIETVMAMKYHDCGSEVKISYDQFGNQVQELSSEPDPEEYLLLKHIHSLA